VVHVGKREEVYRLWELYEDAQDAALIEALDVREDAGDTGFTPIDDRLHKPG
jgi:hypothetical protein